MSTATAGNGAVLAGIVGGEARAQASGVRSAGKPKRPFAETAALVQAGETAGADNVSVGATSRCIVAAGNKLIVTMQSLSDRPGVTKSLRQRVAKAISACGRAQDSTKASAVQVAGWDAPVCAVPPRFGDGGLDASPDGGGAKRGRLAAASGKTKPAISPADCPVMGRGLPGRVGGQQTEGTSSAREGSAAAAGLGANDTSPVFSGQRAARRAASASGPEAGKSSPVAVKEALRERATDAVKQTRQKEGPAGARSELPVDDCQRQGQTGRGLDALHGSERNTRRSSIPCGSPCTEPRSTRTAPRARGETSGKMRVAGQSHDPRRTTDDAGHARSPSSASGPQDCGLSPRLESAVGSCEVTFRCEGPARSAQPEMAGTTPSSNAGNAGPGISEQILDSVRTSLARGEREVEIRLHPPELGSILARFKEQDGQLHGMLEVNRSDTRQEIERAMPQVLQSLQDLGVQVKRLDVTIADQSRRDAGGEQLSQEAWSQQHNSGQNRDPLQATPMRWLHDGADFSVESNETPDTGQQTGVGQRGINVLL